MASGMAIKGIFSDFSNLFLSHKFIYFNNKKKYFAVPGPLVSPAVTVCNAAYAVMQA